jgi:serine phosphatase RsbU (regulator of sigma subunit)
MDIVGGDFYEFVGIDEKEVGIFISDVSGHGVPAALITSMIKVAVSSISPRYISKPAKFFQLINDALIDKTATNFITAFYGIYNSETRLFRFSNAGHCSPLLYRKKTNEMIPLRAEGILLGIFNGVSFEEKSVQLEAGDKLILYTDGLIETMDKNRNLYGFDGLINFTEKNNTLPISAYIHSLYDNVCDWALSKNFEDDIVIIGIEIL